MDGAAPAARASAFRLVLASEVEALKDLDEQIRPLAYGESYDELEPYLRSLGGTSRTTVDTDSATSVDYGELVLGGFALGKAEVFSVAMSPDGGVIAAGTGRRDPAVGYDEAEGRRRRDGADPAKRLPEPTSYVYSVAFGAGGSLLASGDQDGFVRVWDVGTRKQLWEDGGRHTDAVYSVAFAPDGTRVVSGGYDGTVVLWNVAKGTSPLSSASISRVSSVALSNDGRLVAIGYLDNHVRLWDTHGTTLKPLGEHAQLGRDCRLLARRPPRRQLGARQDREALGCREPGGCVEGQPRSRPRSRVPRTFRGVLARRKDDRERELGQDRQALASRGRIVLSDLPFKEGLPWHEDWIWSVAFSDVDAMVLATGGSDGLTLWRVDESARGPS